MHRISLLRDFVAVVFLCATTLKADSELLSVNNYERWLGCAVFPARGDTSVVLRRFRLDSATRFLAVNPRTLSTEIVDSGSAEVAPASWSELQRRFGETPYLRALAKAGGQGASLQDAGITRFDSLGKGIDLTVDLCPSSKPLDRVVFTNVANALGKEQQPAPVAIAVTGLWMREHPGDFTWLVGLANSNVLAITWINHTYHHYTNKLLPLRNNFMLAKGIAVDKEVLETEKALIMHGQVPSVFFRFPGLVSDSTLFSAITGFGLIPIGSDAWLAKGQEPSAGSIVLIHANGNEPLGVHRFINLLRRERDSISGRRWRLFDLRKSVATEEQP